MKKDLKNTVKIVPDPEKKKRPLYDAMQKYGKEHFQICLLEECSIDIINEREKYWIEYYNSYHFGYNATYGGDGTILYDYRKLADIYLECQNLTETAQKAQCDVDTVRKALREYHIEILTSGQVLSDRAKKASPKIIATSIVDPNESILFNDIYEAAEWIRQSGKSTAKDMRHIRYAISRVANGKRPQAFDYTWVFDKN